jgi:hypothetical protein
MAIDHCRFRGYFRLSKLLPWEQLVCDQNYDAAWGKLLAITGAFPRGEVLVTSSDPNNDRGHGPGQRRHQDGVTGDKGDGQ